MVHFQNSILEHLHHHTPSKMLFDKILEIHRAWILSCFSLKVGNWLIVWLIFPTFWLSSPIFSTTFWMWFELPHPSIASLPQCVCTHPINPMGIHFLCYTHGNKGIRTHDVVRNIFSIIAWDVDFHMGREQLHAFPSITLNSFCQWINIVFTKDGNFTLAIIVITDPTCANLLPRSCTTQGFVTSNVVQAKKMNYHNQHPSD